MKNGEIENINVEQVSGGMRPDSESGPRPATVPRTGNYIMCRDYFKTEVITLVPGVAAKRLYECCSTCSEWETNTCRSGHF